MVRHSGPLVSSAVACLTALQNHNRPALNTALSTLHQTLLAINTTMQTMWTRSAPHKYTSFRTFIFGITAQSMFPQGVIYAGVDDAKRVDFRGESGANDSMVPLVDNLLAVPMPATPLTEILKDFRKYRPGEHRGFLEWVKRGSEEGGLKGWALQTGEEEGMRESRALWIKCLDQVRDFRWRHWCFAREYILKRTSHPTATGGSPIVTWLPNQLAAVMDEMVRIYEGAGGAEGGLGEEVEGIMDLVGRQREMLRKEVQKFCEERGVEEAAV